jgi:hypothetical protein
MAITTDAATLIVVHSRTVPRTPAGSSSARYMATYRVNAARNPHSDKSPSRASMAKANA